MIQKNPTNVCTLAGAFASFSNRTYLFNAIQDYVIMPYLLLLSCPANQNFKVPFEDEIFFERFVQIEEKIDCFRYGTMYV
jgi:hypothetical protein